MAVNANFYSTINNLANVAAGSTSEALVVDYKTFIDYGKQLSALNGTNLRNTFFDALMNRVSKVINTFRSYEGSYHSIYSDTADGGVIELYTQAFYDAKVAPFVNLGALEDGADMNPYQMAKPKANVSYYTDSVAIQIPLTLADTELRAAFETPMAMDMFIRQRMGDILNSMELSKETARINAVNYAIIGAMTHGVERANDLIPATCYQLSSIYNAKTGESVDETNWQCNEKFVKFVCAVIRAVRKRLSKASSEYNPGGVKTFTPNDDVRLYINSALESAIDTVTLNSYETKALELNENESIPFWQSADNPMKIVTSSVEVGKTTTSVLAVMFDKYAVGEFVCHESTTSTYNAKYLCTHYYFNYQGQYIRNSNANCVVFTVV